MSRFVLYACFYTAVRARPVQVEVNHNVLKAAAPSFPADTLPRHPQNLVGSPTGEEGVTADMWSLIFDAGQERAISQPADSWIVRADDEVEQHPTLEWNDGPDYSYEQATLPDWDDESDYPPYDDLWYSLWNSLPPGTTSPSTTISWPNNPTFPWARESPNYLKWLADKLKRYGTHFERLMSRDAEMHDNLFDLVDFN